MAILDKQNLFGARVLVVGVVLAVVLGVINATVKDLDVLIWLTSTVASLLVVIGLVIGFNFINLSEKEVNIFLISSVSLVIVSFAGTGGIGVIEFLNRDIANMIFSTLGALLIMLIPAIIVVAIKTMFTISRK